MDCSRLPVTELKDTFCPSSTTMPLKYEQPLATLARRPSVLLEVLRSGVLNEESSTISPCSCATVTDGCSVCGVSVTVPDSSRSIMPAICACACVVSSE